MTPQDVAREGRVGGRPVVGDRSVGGERVEAHAEEAPSWPVMLPVAGSQRTRRDCAGRLGLTLRLAAVHTEPSEATVERSGWRFGNGVATSVCSVAASAAVWTA